MLILVFERTTRYCFMMNHDQKITEPEKLVNIAV